MKKVLFSVFILCCVGSAFGQKSSSKKISTQKAPDNIELGHYRSPFRYVIVGNVTELQRNVNDGDENFNIEVLMEDRAFNVKNLTILFEVLSKRFSSRPGLDIDVYTSLDALRTPEEYDKTELFGPIENYRRYKYAFFHRNGYGEYFQYGIPGKVRDKQVFLKRL